MEDKKRKYFQLELLALLFLILLTWGYSIYYGDKNAIFKGSVSVRYNEPTIDYGSMLKATEGFHEDSQLGNAPLISLWNRERGVTIADEDGINKAEVDLIKMNGDMSPVEKEKLLSGYLILKGDLRGCVIDKATAYELYKSCDVLGMTIMLDDKSYNICGILDTTANLMLVQEDNLTEKYAYLEISYPMDKKSTENRLMNDLGTLTGDFLSQYGFPESRVIIDKDFAADILKMVYGLPSSFILLLIVINLLKIYKQTRKVPLIHAVALPATILISVLLGWMADIQLSFPERFIPTRWSDFDFWSRKIDELGHYISELFSIMPLSNDMAFKEYCCKCIIAATLSIILCIVLQYMWKRYLYIDQRNGRHIWVICLCALAVTFLSVCTLYRLDIAIRPTRGYLTIFLGYIFASLLIRWVDTYMNRF